jgi:hypothetical protein
MRKIRYSSLLFFFIMVCFGTANAQWQITFGPYGFGFVRVQCFAKQGTNLFAGTQGDGVWISTDNSANPWTKVSNGLTVLICLREVIAVYLKLLIMDQTGLR